MLPEATRWKPGTRYFLVYLSVSVSAFLPQLGGLNRLRAFCYQNTASEIEAERTKE